jgi:hypothetical protein
VHSSLSGFVCEILILSENHLSFVLQITKEYYLRSALSASKDPGCQLSDDTPASLVLGLQWWFRQLRFLTA